MTESGKYSLVDVARPMGGRQNVGAALDYFEQHPERLARVILEFNKIVDKPNGLMSGEECDEERLTNLVNLKRKIGVRNDMFPKIETAKVVERQEILALARKAVERERELMEKGERGEGGARYHMGGNMKSNPMGLGVAVLFETYGKMVEEKYGDDKTIDPFKDVVLPLEEVLFEFFPRFRIYRELKMWCEEEEGFSPALVARVLGNR